MTDTQGQENVTLGITISPEVAAKLRVLVGNDTGIPDLAGLVLRILDHVQQAVYRPGAWERQWLIQALGESWLERVESDPAFPMLDRPKEAQ